jgi:hypothetical protein
LNWRATACDAIREGFYMTQELALEVKQNQFNSAMELYEKVGIYKVIGKIVSIANVSL